MKKFIQRQRPSTVSLVSFLLMLVVVTGVGLLGGNHVIAYLQRQLMEHGLSHNQAVIDGVMPLLVKPLEAGASPAEVVEGFRPIAAHAGPFGVRLFLIDVAQGRVLADSSPPEPPPYPLGRLAEGKVKRLDGVAIDDLARWVGPAWRTAKNGDLELMSFHPVSAGGVAWTLGVERDFGTLLRFMEELHLHLDWVLLLSHGLIGVLGFVTLRWVGRRYEAGLETQIRLRTEALEAAHRKLLDQARLVTIGQTASVLAHEMRNPLASMKLALSGVLRAQGLDERGRRRLELVLGEVDRLDDLLGEILDYVKPVEKDERPASLDELLDLVLELEKPFLQEKGILLQRRRCPRCCRLRMDRRKMKQVLLNLVKNAREASPPRAPIRIALEQRGERLVLCLVNGGEPPSEEVLAHAFDFFFTTKARGTGLGLGLVKRVVEAHGGEVALSAADGWIEVRLELPCDEGAAS